MRYVHNGSGRKRSSFPLCCFLSLAWALAAIAFPGPNREQTQPAAAQKQTPTFSVRAAMVVVDATVRDRKGNLVGDLKKEDFKIYEDSVEQSIVTFSAENIAVGPGAAAQTQQSKTTAASFFDSPVIVNLGLNPGEPVRREMLSGKRLIILFFDLSSLGSENLILSVDSARDFIVRKAGPQDLFAIATYSSILSLVQDLTNDRDLLLDVLDGISSTDSGDSETEDLSDSASSEDVFVPDTIQFNIFNTDRRLSALETLAKMYQDFPERKSLVYFSSGVSTTGVENNAQIRSTVDNANRSNMSIYTVDSRGLVAMPPGGDASQASAGGGMYRGGAMMRQRSNFLSSQETLTTIAHDTGGQTFADSNDLGLALEKVQQDSSIYYVMGYYSKNVKEDGKYRKIRVEVLRPDLKIEHRPGYFASKAFHLLNKEERDFQLQQALSVDKPFVDIPMILQVDYFRRDNNTAYVPISIELAGNGLVFEEKGDNREGKFEFVAQAVDPEGKVSAVARDSVLLKLPAERAEKIKAGGIFYSTAFQLRPGDYSLKFLVRDNINGKMGSFEQPIRVPAFDLKELKLSSIVLGDLLVDARGETGSAVRHEGSMRGFHKMRFSYDPLVIGNKKVTPSIGNVFLARQTVYVYFHVYGAMADEGTQNPCIETDLMLIKDNEKILETEPQYLQEWNNAGGGRRFGPGGGAAKKMPGMMGPGGPDGPPGMPGVDERTRECVVAISLPLKNLKDGTYTLQLHVYDAVADVNQFHRVPIVITSGG